MINHMNLFHTGGAATNIIRALVAMGIGWCPQCKVWLNADDWHADHSNHIKQPEIDTDIRESVGRDDHIDDTNFDQENEHAAFIALIHATSLINYNTRCRSVGFAGSIWRANQDMTSAPLLQWRSMRPYYTDQITQADAYCAALEVALQHGIRVLRIYHQSNTLNRIIQSHNNPRLQELSSNIACLAKTF
jgi:hypothetical protein